MRAGANTGTLTSRAPGKREQRNRFGKIGGNLWVRELLMTDGTIEGRLGPGSRQVESTDGFCNNLYFFLLRLEVRGPILKRAWNPQTHADP